MKKQMQQQRGAASNRTIIVLRAKAENKARYWSKTLEEWKKSWLKLPGHRQSVSI